jgi:hypothetical protein
MNIIKYIQGLFKTQPKEETDNQLTISVQKNGTIVVDMQLPNASTTDAEQFAYMLFMLNEGRLCQTILNLLSDFAAQNTSGINFMEKSILTWHNLIDAYEQTLEQAGGNKTNKNNDPIVSPSQFYQNIGHKG